MKYEIIDWTWFGDPAYLDMPFSDDSYFEKRKIVIQELRNHNYKFSGYDHQGADTGVPVFNDGTRFEVTYRGWGKIMAEAHPETIPNYIEPGCEYCYWAWSMPQGQTYNMPKKRGKK